MKINRSNYEQYFIDYLDGKLDPDQEKILLSFLDFNPGLKKELEGLERTHLVPVKYSYSKKDSLLKMVPPFEEMCIDFIEHQLDEEEEKRLIGSISEDTEKQIIYKLYQSSKLVPDMDIRFMGKSKLKKFTLRKTGIRIVIPAVAAAAILLIALIVYSPEDRIPVPQEISQTESQDQLLIPEAPQEQDIINIAEVQAQTDDKVLHEVTTAQLMQTERREPIRLSRIQPLGITKVITISSIPSYALMHKLQEDQGLLQQMAIDQLDSKLQTARSVPERARNALWKIADAGVRGLNSIAEEEIELVRNVDDDGQIRGFKFETSIFGISTPLRNTNLSQ